MKWNEPRLKQRGQTPAPWPLAPGRFLNWRSWITHGVIGGVIRGAKAFWREFRLSSQL